MKKDLKDKLIEVTNKININGSALLEAIMESRAIVEMNDIDEDILTGMVDEDEELKAVVVESIGVLGAIEDLF